HVHYMTMFSPNQIQLFIIRDLRNIQYITANIFRNYKIATKPEGDSLGFNKTPIKSARPEFSSPDLNKQSDIQNQRTSETDINVLYEFLQENHAKTERFKAELNNYLKLIDSTFPNQVQDVIKHHKSIQEIICKLTAYSSNKEKIVSNTELYNQIITIKATAEEQLAKLVSYWNGHLSQLINSELKGKTLLDAVQIIDAFHLKYFMGQETQTHLVLLESKIKSAITVNALSIQNDVFVLIRNQVSPTPKLLTEITEDTIDSFLTLYEDLTQQWISFFKDNAPIIQLLRYQTLNLFPQVSEFIAPICDGWIAYLELENKFEAYFEMATPTILANRFEDTKIYLTFDNMIKNLIAIHPKTNSNILDLLQTLSSQKIDLNWPESRVPETCALLNQIFHSSTSSLDQFIQNLKQAYLDTPSTVLSNLIDKETLMNEFITFLSKLSTSSITHDQNPVSDVKSLFRKFKVLIERYKDVISKKKLYQTKKISLNLPYEIVLAAKLFGERQWKSKHVHFFSEKFLIKQQYLLKQAKQTFKTMTSDSKIPFAKHIKDFIETSQTIEFNQQCITEIRHLLLGNTSHDPAIEGILKRAQNTLDNTSTCVSSSPFGSPSKSSGAKKFSQTDMEEKKDEATKKYALHLCDNHEMQVVTAKTNQNQILRAIAPVLTQLLSAISSWRALLRVDYDAQISTIDPHSELTLYEIITVLTHYRQLDNDHDFNKAFDDALPILATQLYDKTLPTRRKAKGSAKRNESTSHKDLLEEALKKRKVISENGSNIKYLAIPADFNIETRPDITEATPTDGFANDFWESVFRSEPKSLKEQYFRYHQDTILRLIQIDPSELNPYLVLDETAKTQETRINALKYNPKKPPCPFVRLINFYKDGIHKDLLTYLFTAKSS
ncbi:MAG: hypothetical protein VW397_07560, partial [Candidatus Margulisiibacteriota bacterium]